MKRAVEPVRKSLLDVIKKNLRAAGKITYITRVVYVGGYTGMHFNVEQKMESIMHSLQEDYTKISISGMFLVYPEYYIHVVEAPEDIIYRHFKALYDDNCKDCTLEKAIFLPTYHYVHQRFFTEWFHVYVVPPTLIQKLQSYELSDLQHQMTLCFNKIYTLCDFISNTVHDYTIPMAEVVRNLDSKITRLYPESTLLEYLLNANNPVLFTVEEYLRICSKVPDINLYSDTTWPPPHDYMFCTGFEKKNIINDDFAKYRRNTRRSIT